MNTKANKPNYVQINNIYLTAFWYNAYFIDINWKFEFNMVQV